MEMQVVVKPKPEKRKFKYFSLPSEPKKKAVKPKEFFYIGTDKNIISLLLANFDSGFCSEDLPKGAHIIDMLITRKISLPDAIIIQNGFHDQDMDGFFLKLQDKIHAIPVIIEGSNASALSLQQYKFKQGIDDVFILNENTVQQFINKIGFLKKIKTAVSDDLAVLEGQSVDHHLNITDFGKQIFDITIALIAIVILSPVFLLIAALIKLESKGPVLYCSPRVGRGYKIFNFYKFRTMEVGADSKVHDLYHLNQYNTISDTKSPMFFKVLNDPRVTRLGKFLRNTSLDELPQFFNVLKGDMSVVGNRPLPLYEAETLTTDEWAKRFLAPAGITGLWQISKKSKRKMTIEERINLDIDYAAKHNFAYDLWILANTATAMLQKDETA